MNEPHTETPSVSQGDALELDEHIRRVIYSVLLPAVRLAFVFKVPVKELVDLLQMAYYHETRRRRLKMREASDLLGVSMRKVALLSKRLKQNFLRSETDHELPRRIEFMLWADELSEARIAQSLPEATAEEVAEALGQLVAQGRIEASQGRLTTFRVLRSEYRLVRDTMLARIDGLNNLLSATANVVFGRFFKNEPRTFARTVSLRIRKDDLSKLDAMYREKVWTTLLALDKAAQGDEDAEEIDVSLMWGPYEYVLREMDRGDG